MPNIKKLQHKQPFTFWYRVENFIPGKISSEKSVEDPLPNLGRYTVIHSVQPFSNFYNRKKYRKIFLAVAEKRPGEERERGFHMPPNIKNERKYFSRTIWAYYQL